MQTHAMDDQMTSTSGQWMPGACHGLCIW